MVVVMVWSLSDPLLVTMGKDIGKRYESGCCPCSPGNQASTSSNGHRDRDALRRKTVSHEADEHPTIQPSQRRGSLRNHPRPLECQQTHRPKSEHSTVNAKRGILVATRTSERSAGHGNP
jgi:hypothetical protein